MTIGAIIMGAVFISWIVFGVFLIIAISTDESKKNIQRAQSRMQEKELRKAYRSVFENRDGEK